MSNYETVSLEAEGPQDPVHDPNKPDMPEPTIPEPSPDEPTYPVIDPLPKPEPFPGPPEPIIDPVPEPNPFPGPPEPIPVYPPDVVF